jgi:hypothetical protein
MSRNRDELLKQAFADGVRWPIERAFLRALLDMGLTVPQRQDVFQSSR